MRWTFQGNVQHSLRWREREGGKPNIKAHFSKYQGKIVEDNFFPPEKEERKSTFFSSNILPEPGPLLVLAEPGPQRIRHFLVDPLASPPWSSVAGTFLLSGNSRLRESLNFLFCPNERQEAEAAIDPGSGDLCLVAPIMMKARTVDPEMTGGKTPVGANRCGARGARSRPLLGWQPLEKKKGFPSVATL